MSLPSAWVDKIFTRLSLNYGDEFLRRYGSMSLVDVKTNWAHELGGFEAMPEAIAYALQYLPADRAPTVLQFRDLCRQAPRANELLLAPPKTKIVSPEVIAATRKAFKPVRNTGNRDWAYALKRQEESGDRLTKAQRDMWRAAIAVDQPASAEA